MAYYKILQLLLTKILQWPNLIVAPAYGFIDRYSDISTVIMSNPLKDTEDVVLWFHYRTGDEKAFTELSRRYFRALVHYGLKFTPNRQIVEDAIQDILIRLWLNRNTIASVESVKFYLLKSFRHQLFKTLKKNTGHAELTGDFEHAYVEFTSMEDSFIQEESSRLFQDKVQDMLKHLTPRQREIIYLRFFQGLSTDEIAALMSINSQSVSNIIQRSFAKLREAESGASAIRSLLYCLSTIMLFYHPYAGPAQLNPGQTRSERHAISLL